MAASCMANVSFFSTAGSSNFYHHRTSANSKSSSFTCGVSSQIHRHALFSSVPRSNAGFRCRYGNSGTFPSIICSAANKPSSPADISSTAKLRSEVLSPFRSVRMFFYLAFIASGGLGGLIALTRLIAAVTNPARAAEVPEMLQGLGIDIAAVSVFAFLYYRENSAKQAQIARLSREENLSNLKLRVNDKRIIPVSSLRGVARLVICAGPESYILESCRLSEPFTQSLLDRGVLVVPFATDGSSPTFDFDESEEAEGDSSNRKRLWQLSPTIISDWSKWLDEQKKLAGVPPESPVYISLRLDGRVRGSGVGYPPWNALVAQLPPMKGMWSGLFDGFDGRV